MSVSVTDIVEVIKALGGLPLWVSVVLLAFLLNVFVRIYAHTTKQLIANDHAMDDVAKLQHDKAQLLVWASKAVRHFSGCGNCNSFGQIESREDLEKEYLEMVEKMK